jgi:hypothetical protein
MIQRQCLGQTIREERSTQAQLVVCSSRIGRVQARIAFGLKATDDIYDVDQTHLPHPFHPHNQMSHPFAIPDVEK